MYLNQRGITSIALLMILLFVSLGATFYLVNKSGPLKLFPKAESPAAVDVLDYFITKHPDKSLDGDREGINKGHPLSQTIIGKKIYYVKWDPNTYEVYHWDNDNIYLVEDHSGAPVNFYGFKPGIWMKRFMQIGESVQSDTNNIQWYDSQCNKTENRRFPIIVTFEQHIADFNAGGDLGKQDVIVFRYDYYGNNYEKFYYSKEWGWILWEEYSKQGDPIPINRSVFNKINQNPIVPSKDKECDSVSNQPESNQATASTIPQPSSTEQPSDQNNKGISLSNPRCIPKPKCLEDHFRCFIEMPKEGWCSDTVVQ